MQQIQTYKPFFDNDELKKVNSTLRSGWIANGKITENFENKIKKKLKTNNAIAVNSCTSGINAVLNSLNLNKGDEVITTLLTFISTIHSLYSLGLKIRFVDIDRKNFSMNCELLKKKISKKTKLVLVNHYGGIPSNIKKIIGICKKNKISVLEDAATVFGAKIKKRYIGSYDYSTTVFSFQANKIMTTGEGGIITTKNNFLGKKIRKKIFNGFQKDNVVSHGFKYNFTDIQASIGIIQLNKLNKIINYRKKLRLLYNKELSNLEKKNYISLYKENKDISPSEYIYTILINEKKCGPVRNKLVNFLNKKNIHTRVHYLTADKTEFYKKKLNYRNLPNSLFVSRNILSIPFHNSLKPKNIKYISNCIRKFFKGI